jgi:hypothetical protein
MGNLNSSQATMSALQNRPGNDSQSSLNYSGQVYTNQVSLMTQPMCTSQAKVDLDSVFPNGIATDQLTVDQSTKRISTSALQGYVENLKLQGKIPPQLVDVDAQLRVDKAFYATVQQEYCFLESQYITALTQFITEISSKNGGDTTLAATISLNTKLNSLLEITNYIGNDRARKVNDRNSQINTANNQINERLAALQAQQKFLQSSDVRLQTEQEMMRFSKEKNSAMNIQIMFFVALNVVALGTVFTVYKGLRASE